MKLISIKKNNKYYVRHKTEKYFTFGNLVFDVDSIEEVDLIAEYEMEYGDTGNWSDKIHKEFDEKWDKIQKSMGDKKWMQNTGN